MVPDTSVEKTTCSLQEWQLCLPYFCCYRPLLYLTLIMHWFSVCYVSWTLFSIFWWYLVVMKNRTRRHVAYKNDNFSFFLLLELSPLLGFEFDFLSLLCNKNTLQNILMMLGKNVEQDEMTCCVQEWNAGEIGRLGWWWGDICFLKPFLVSH